MDLVTLKTVFKFSSVLSCGMYFGGSFYAGRTHFPGMLAVKDLSQSVRSFQYFWPRAFQMPLSNAIAGLGGVAVYLVDRQQDDKPWLAAGSSMLSLFVYTGLVVYPYSIKPLMEMKKPENEDDKMIESLFKKFNMYHHARTAVAGGCFILFTYYFYCS